MKNQRIENRNDDLNRMGNDNLATPITTSVVISTKDRNSRLRLVLRALEKQMRPDTEVIIVFDGCTKETVEEFKTFKFSFEPILVISEKNVRYAAARNMGIKRALGQRIIFVDDDRVPGPDFLATHIAAHKSKCVLLGERKEITFTEQELVDMGKDPDFEERFKSQLYKAKRNVDSPFSLSRRIFYHTKLPFKWICFLTGNVSVEKEDIVRAGLFDETLKTWGHEDEDMGYRLYKLKVPFYKDLTAVNYHLTHNKHYLKTCVASRGNVYYLLKKYKGEFNAQFGLKLQLFLIKCCELALVFKKEED